MASGQKTNPACMSLSKDRTIAVSNLPMDTRLDLLECLFPEAKEIYMNKDQHLNTTRGSCLVVFRRPRSALFYSDKEHSIKLDSRELIIKYLGQSVGNHASYPASTPTTATTNTTTTTTTTGGGGGGGGMEKKLAAPVQQKAEETRDEKRVVVYNVPKGTGKAGLLKVIPTARSVTFRGPPQKNKYECAVVEFNTANQARTVAKKSGQLRIGNTFLHIRLKVDTNKSKDVPGSSSSSLSTSGVAGGAKKVDPPSTKEDTTNATPSSTGDKRLVCMRGPGTNQVQESVAHDAMTALNNLLNFPKVGTNPKTLDRGLSSLENLLNQTSNMKPGVLQKFLRANSGLLHLLQKNTDFHQRLLKIFAHNGGVLPSLERIFAKPGQLYPDRVRHLMIAVIATGTDIGNNSGSSEKAPSCAGKLPANSVSSRSPVKAPGSSGSSVKTATNSGSSVKTAAKSGNSGKPPGSSGISVKVPVKAPESSTKRTSTSTKDAPGKSTGSSGKTGKPVATTTTTTRSGTGGKVTTTTTTATTGSKAADGVGARKAPSKRLVGAEPSGKRESSDRGSRSGSSGRRIREGVPRMREGEARMREGVPRMREGEARMRGVPRMREGEARMREGEPRMREGEARMEGWSRSAERRLGEAEEGDAWWSKRGESRRMWEGGEVRMEGWGMGATEEEGGHGYHPSHHDVGVAGDSGRRVEMWQEEVADRKFARSHLVAEADCDRRRVVSLDVHKMGRGDEGGVAWQRGGRGREGELAKGGPMGEVLHGDVGMGPSPLRHRYSGPASAPTHHLMKAGYTDADKREMYDAGGSSSSGGGGGRYHPALDAHDRDVYGGGGGGDGGRGYHPAADNDDDREMYGGGGVRYHPTAADDREMYGDDDGGGGYHSAIVVDDREVYGDGGGYNPSFHLDEREQMAMEGTEEGAVGDRGGVTSAYLNEGAYGDEDGYDPADRRHSVGPGQKRRHSRTRLKTHDGVLASHGPSFVGDPNDPYYANAAPDRQEFDVVSGGVDGHGGSGVGDDDDGRGGGGGMRRNRPTMEDPLTRSLPRPPRLKRPAPGGGSGVGGIISSVTANDDDHDDYAHEGARYSVDDDCAMLSAPTPSKRWASYGTPEEAVGERRAGSGGGVSGVGRRDDDYRGGGVDPFNAAAASFAPRPRHRQHGQWSEGQEEVEVGGRGLRRLYGKGEEEEEEEQGEYYGIGGGKGEEDYYRGGGGGGVADRGDEGWGRRRRDDVDGGGGGVGALRFDIPPPSSTPPLSASDGPGRGRFVHSGGGVGADKRAPPDYYGHGGSGGDGGASAGRGGSRGRGDGGVSAMTTTSFPPPPPQHHHHHQQQQLYEDEEGVGDGMGSGGGGVMSRDGGGVGSSRLKFISFDYNHKSSAIPVPDSPVGLEGVEQEEMEWGKRRTSPYGRPSRANTSSSVTTTTSHHHQREIGNSGGGSSGVYCDDDDYYYGGRGGGDYANACGGDGDCRDDMYVGGDTGGGGEGVDGDMDLGFAPPVNRHRQTQDVRGGGGGYKDDVEDGVVGRRGNSKDRFRYQMGSRRSEGGGGDSEGRYGGGGSDRRRVALSMAAAGSGGGSRRSVEMDTVQLESRDVEGDGWGQEAISHGRGVGDGGRDGDDYGYYRDDDGDYYNGGGDDGSDGINEYYESGGGGGDAGGGGRSRLAWGRGVSNRAHSSDTNNRRYGNDGDEPSSSSHCRNRSQSPQHSSSSKGGGDCRKRERRTDDDGCSGGRAEEDGGDDDQLPLGWRNIPYLRYLHTTPTTPTRGGRRGRGRAARRRER
ncbi:hypothetical protein Ahia01_001192800 [Argonauta hians]